MANVMVLFGSGGHSSEMLMLIRNAKLTDRLNMKEFQKLTCVISEDDNLIEDKIREEFRRCRSKHKLETYRLKRARQVGQSYITSVWTTFTGILNSIYMIISQRPHLCITNGPAISVTTSLAIRCMSLLTFLSYKCEIIYIESFCRTESLSLSGNIIYYLRLADQFYVQWPALKNTHNRAIYKGILV